MTGGPSPRRTARAWRSLVPARGSGGLRQPPRGNRRWATRDPAVGPSSRVPVPGRTCSRRRYSSSNRKGAAGSHLRRPRPGAVASRSPSAGAGRERSPRRQMAVRLQCRMGSAGSSSSSSGRPVRTASNSSSRAGGSSCRHHHSSSSTSHRRSNTSSSRNGGRGALGKPLQAAPTRSTRAPGTATPQGTDGETPGATKRGQPAWQFRSILLLLPLVLVLLLVLVLVLVQLLLGRLLVVLGVPASPRQRRPRRYPPARSRGGHPAWVYGRRTNRTAKGVPPRNGLAARTAEPNWAGNGYTRGRRRGRGPPAGPPAAAMSVVGCRRVRACGRG